ncbi:30S ribosomal protein S8 [Candidatus Curtissbacteria bacterium]|nr:30S ribosomal protein S8 [Candidatus Curtissbacteria bacterium]
MDPIADMLVIIKNGYLASKPEVKVKTSRFRLEVAKVLGKLNFIKDVTESEGYINIGLIYNNNEPRVHELKKVSKLGLRIYTKSKHLMPIKGGIGAFVVSTPQGVMSGQEAKKKKLGGEVVCLVW